MAILFKKQEVENVCEAIKLVKETKFDVKKLRNRSLYFSDNNFKGKISGFIEGLLSDK